MSTFFTSDQHYFHNNIIKYCNRPFSSVKEMNRVITDNYNSVVKENDIVFHLGDFTMLGSGEVERIRSIVNNLNGRKHLILGNHDRFKPFQYIDLGFKSVHTWFKIGDFNLVHDPAQLIVDKTQNWLCGHVHTLFKKLDKCINVGVDMWDFYPVSLETITKEFSNV